MGISEQVLYSTLAQIQKKKFNKDVKSSKDNFDSFTIIKPENEKNQNYL